MIHSALRTLFWYICAEVFEEVLEIVSYMTFFSPTISMDMWSLWPLMMESLADFAIDYFPSMILSAACIAEYRGNFIGTSAFIFCFMIILLR